MELASLLTAVAALLAGVVACAYCRSAIAVVRLSPPNQLGQMVRDLSERVLNGEAILESYSAKLTTWRAEMEGVLEGVEGALDRTERKRRSISSAESRARRREESERSDSDPVALLARARAQGIWGD